jgi:hypothetical protein
LRVSRISSATSKSRYIIKVIVLFCKYVILVKLSIHGVIHDCLENIDRFSFIITAFFLFKITCILVLEAKGPCKSIFTFFLNRLSLEQVFE